MRQEHLSFDENQLVPFWDNPLTLENKKVLQILQHAVSGEVIVRIEGSPDFRYSDEEIRYLGDKGEDINKDYWMLGMEYLVACVADPGAPERITERPCSILLEHFTKS